MKIICIGRNYAEHAKELNNPVPSKAVFFLKPATSLLRNGRPFFYPDFSQDIHYELELVVRINKMGKSIPQAFALNYIDQITLGVDFTARDLQADCKAKGLPWEIAKAFDYSALVGDYIPFRQESAEAYHFELFKNGEKGQDGHSKEMIFSFASIISYVSQFITLRTGDLIFTGTPAGVGPVQPGDRLEGFLDGVRLVHTRIK